MVLTCIELSGLLLIIGVGSTRWRAASGEPRRLVEINTGDDRRVPGHHRGHLAGLLRHGRVRGLGEHGRGVPRPAADLPEGHAPRDGRRRADLRGGRGAVLDAGAGGRAGRGQERRAVPGAGGGRTRVPAGGVRGDRPVRGGQLGSDQHADGQPAALRHVQRADPPAVVRPGAPEPAHAVGVDRLHQCDRDHPGGHAWTSPLLGGTTALLLLGVFTIVNIAVLVLRRATAVDTTALPRPVLDAVARHRALRVPGHPAVRAAAAGVPDRRHPARGRCALLWVVNRLVVGRVDVDADRSGASADTRPVGPMSTSGVRATRTEPRRISVAH